VSRFLEAEINLTQLAENFKQIKQYLNEKKASCKTIAIIKADAYGHGAIESAKCYEALGVDYLGVAFFEEALILRESGIKSKILMLFDREIEGVFKNNLTPVVFDYKQAKMLSKEAEKRGMILPIHVKVETGMGRLGIYENPCNAIKEIANLKNLKIEGIMSHLSIAEDKDWTQNQVEKLMKIRDCLRKFGLTPIFHIANSRGLFYENALFDAVRPGLMLYGYGSVNSQIIVKPCMTVKTKILDIRKLPAGMPISYGGTFKTKRESLIGVIPVGYADGYLRGLSNKAMVIVKGEKVPVVGTICMDLTMIDLTQIKDVEINDDVILMGEKNQEKITAEDIATWANTIPYEVLICLGSKAKRKYIQ